MNLFDAILLGLVQGLAEFLPISSSGHLVIVEHLLSIQQTNIVFEVFLHFATLLAILIFFKKAILTIKFKEVIVIAVASIPATVIGVLFKNQLEIVFSSLMIVSLLLIVTGVVNLVTDRKLNKNNVGDKDVLSKTQKTKKEVGIKEALIIGIFQAFAILPGISRSGSTVAGGILQNIDREKAFRFSFLMVIPVILGASLLQLIKVLNSGINSLDFTTLFAGGLTAFVSGFLSLKIFAYIIKKARLEVFGYYCIGLGVVSLAMSYFF